jgi:hypothetical protein
MTKTCEKNLAVTFEAAKQVHKNKKFKRWCIAWRWTWPGYEGGEGIKGPSPFLAPLGATSWQPSCAAVLCMPAIEDSEAPVGLASSRTKIHILVHGTLK